MRLNKKYSDLIYKKLQDSLSPDEQKELDDWLAADSKRHLQVDRIKQTLQLSKRLPKPFMPDKDAIWNEIAQKTFLAPAPEKRGHFNGWWQLHIERGLQKRLGYAVAILFLFILGYGAIRTYFNPYVSVVAKHGEQKHYNLADGSMIELNCGSAIKFRKSFALEHRQLYLSGEVYFEVRKAKFPFIINTENASITVVGTKFNVCARDERTNVFVTEGKVRVEIAEKDTLPIFLEKDQFCEIKAGRVSTFASDTDSSRLLAWRSGTLIFKQTLLANVARSLERFYNITIKISEPELAKRTLTATFYKLSADQAISSICTTLNIEYEKQSKTFILKSKTNHHD
ncbi:FecR domain-containing protein [candidate division KSB1 bacterium]|nr:FecR domain-containing protein [candidate division KSB1 bacterium]